MKPGPKPGTPQARHGGLAHSREHLQEIGRLGGQITKAKYDDGEYYAFIGQAGGQETLRRHGREHFKDIGRKGGRISRGAA